MKLKRFFDIVFSVSFLTVFSPVYLLAYIGIKCSSSGPVLYKAKRVGYKGKVFDCYKFRSMRVDSGKVRLTTLKNDDRIFPFGKFIRKTKIDEMPQILNILKGDMSVVGPRPEDTINADKLYTGENRCILSVYPGLTSPASLFDYTHGELYEDEADYEKEILPKKIELEKYYVKNQSFGYDMSLILRTASIIIQKTLGRTIFPIPKELNS